MKMEPERAVRVARLLDHYGDLVTPRQREALHLYCDEDFSLGEMAAHFGTSRQAVHDCLRRAIQALEAADASLGLVADTESWQAQLDRALVLVHHWRRNGCVEEKSREELEELRRLLEDLRSRL